MTAKFGHSAFFKKGLRLLLLLCLVLSVWQVLPGDLSGRPNQVSAAGDPVIATAGDIACDPANSNFNSGNGTSVNCRQKYTSDLLVNGGFAAILPLGDEQYYCGSLQAFNQSYDLSWGRVKSITHPVVGNHEYLTSAGSTGATACDPSNSNAAGYFSYYGSAAGAQGQGYYSYDVGTWHIIALNSNCSNVGGCGTSSPQYNWLKSDLAAHTNFCTLAYWHIPLFSSGGRAAANTQQFWNLLYSNNADLILNGHDHIYERFAPQNPSGVADPTNGIREFIVGTGGSDHTTIPAIAANSELRNASTYGILKLTLHPTSYDWQFVPEAGKTFTDTGTTACHGGTPPTPTNTPAITQTSTRTSTLAGTNTFTNTPSLTPAVSNTPTNTLVASNTPTATTSGGTTFTFNPVADSYVDSANPTVNNGTATTMRADGSPDVHALLRFSVSGLSGTITSASLQLHANSSGNQGLVADAVANTTWGETTVNYNNAPPLGAVISSTGVFASGATVTLNLTGYISGNGLFSVGLTNPSSTALSLASRESGANAPKLVITVSGGSGSTPTNTSAPSNTPTATQTPTFTNTPAVSNTPTNTPTFTNTPAASNTPTNTPTFTNTPVVSDTPTNTPTQTNTSVASDTPTNTPTFTNTSAATDTPTNTPTLTPTTATNTPTNTPTFTPTTATNTPTNTPTFTPTPTTSTGSTFTFTAAADAYVDSSNPTANFGTGTTIRADASPIVNGYMRFNVSGLTGTITRVRLLIFANSSLSQGIRVASVADNTWVESSVNYNSAPPLGSQLAASTSISSMTWVTLDVTAYVTGNGTYSFGITDPSSTAISMASRESGLNAAQLIVDTQ